MKNKRMPGTFEIPGVEYLDSGERRQLFGHTVPGSDGNDPQEMGQYFTPL